MNRRSELTFKEWLDETQVLQRGSFGVDPATLEGEEFITYVRNSALAAFVELGEFLNGLRWKFYGSQVNEPHRRRPEGDEREHAIEEIVDVMHFLANILVALRANDEVSPSYLAKMQVNRERQIAAMKGKT